MPNINFRKNRKKNLEENGRGQMSCGHYIKRIWLLNQLQTAINDKKPSILCPQCSKKWTF